MRKKVDIQTLGKTEDKTYVGNHAFYKQSEKGIAFITELMFSGRSATGREVFTVEGVGREEAWLIMKNWLKENIIKEDNA